MKTLLVVLSLLAFNFAFAQAETCPAFPYDLSDEEGVEWLSTQMVVPGDVLTADEGIQLLATAQWLATRNDETVPQDVQSGVVYLRDSSSGGDVAIYKIRFQEKSYTVVQAFPGDNAYGLVFSGNVAIAERTDGDVTCLSQQEVRSVLGRTIGM